jgi:hypothetical protein
VRRPARLAAPALKCLAVEPPFAAHSRARVSAELRTQWPWAEAKGRGHGPRPWALRSSARATDATSSLRVLRVLHLMRRIINTLCSPNARGNVGQCNTFDGSPMLLHLRQMPWMPSVQPVS